MKKIFVIIAALFVGVNAFAALQYDTKINGSVTVTDQTSAYPVYILEWSQKGTSRSNGTTYDTSVYLKLYPESHSLAGTYSFDDWSIDSYSYVLNGSAYRYLEDDYTSGCYNQITITDNGDGTYSLSGSLCGYKSSSYYCYYYAADDNTFEYTPEGDDPDEEEYGDEPSAAKKISFTSNTMDVESGEGVAPVQLYFMKADWSQDVTLLFNVPSYDIPEGEYEISDSGDNGTIQAADGKMTGYYYNPSYYSEEGPDYSSIPYFLVSGKLNVAYADGNILITGKAISAHGSEITLNLSAKDPFDHSGSDPVIYEANKDGETATVTGISGSYTGDAVTIASIVKIGGADYTVTAIADNAFACKSGIKSIVIPATVETIGKSAFSLCTGLTSIECKAVAAPTAGATAFYKINPTITVTVPSASVDSYKSADGWKMFTNIKGE